MTRMFAAAFAAITLAVAPAFGAGPAVDAAAKSSVNPIAIAMFIGFVMLTLGITYWAAKRTRSASHFVTPRMAVSGARRDRSGQTAKPPRSEAPRRLASTLADLLSGR